MDNNSFQLLGSSSKGFMKIPRKGDLMALCIQTIMSVCLILKLLMFWNTLVALGFLTIVNLIIGISVSKGFDMKTYSVIYDDSGLRINIYRTIAMNVLITLVITAITLVSIAIIRISA